MLLNFVKYSRPGKVQQVEGLRKASRLDLYHGAHVEVGRSAWCRMPIMTVRRRRTSQPSVIPNSQLQKTNPEARFNSGPPESIYLFTVVMKKMLC